MKRFRYVLILAVVCGGFPGGGAARADEGMWTFDNLPLQMLRQKYNFTPTEQWLEHVRLSCVRLNDGGSGSFVSPKGLLLTNHHVARGQLQKNSTREHDYIRDGFYAATPEQEMKSPDLEVNVLISMENVTDRLTAAMRGAATPAEQVTARRAAIAAIERESQQKTGLRSDVVSLYHGGEYWLYRYKKYTDVRLVFAPEQQIAFFGGDSDNFTYPRHDLDMALFRVYENGRPLESHNYLRWNPKGAVEDELVFVAGHPGSTQRLATMAQLEYQRDIASPSAIKSLKDRIAAMKAYAALGAEQARQAASMIFGLENSLKSYQGSYAGLLDRNVMEKKRADETAFRERVMANPEWKAAWGGAWDAIAAAEQKMATRYKEVSNRGASSQLFSLAMNLVQYAAEIKKPNGERLESFQESQLESLRYRMLSPAPIYPALEIARLAGGLEQSLAELGPDDPFMKLVLNGRSPKEVTAALVNGSKLADPAVRKKLLDGGEAAIAASDDAMIVLARQYDPMQRELNLWVENNVSGVIQRAGEQLGKARFAVYGKSTYPDATFTLRLSYGQVKGYAMNGTRAPAKTTFYGLYDRAYSFGFEGGYDLPSRYKEGRDKLDLTTPLDFVTTNDVVGGNSGSPVINRNGEIVGLVFDGNIKSLVGKFVYDGESNRTVNVHTAAMTEALRKMYGAQKLLNELMSPSR